MPIWCPFFLSFTVCWDKVFKDCGGYNVQKNYDMFLDIVHLLMKMHIPKKLISVKLKHNRKLRNLARRKAILYK